MHLKAYNTEVFALFVAGSHLYVSSEGEFEVIKEEKVLGRMGPGKAFGELAILYNCTRTASIRGEVPTSDHVQMWLKHVIYQLYEQSTCYGLSRPNTKNSDEDDKYQYAS